MKELALMQKEFPLSFAMTNFLTGWMNSLIIFLLFLVFVYNVVYLRYKFHHMKSKFISVQKTDTRFSDIIGSLTRHRRVQGGDRGHRPLPQKPRRVPAHRRQGPQGRAAHRAPGRGQDRAGAGHRDRERRRAHQVNFIALPASDLNQPYVGMGTQLVKNYFQKAREFAPSIIFIDEIDSLTPRDRNMGYTAHLNQLLTEMDGFVESDEIIVIGASNMEDSIDKALKRSGRFDLKIHIPRPWQRSRVELIRFFCAKQAVGVGFDVDNLAKKTSGFSPADLKSLVNLAKLNMLQRRKVSSRSDEPVTVDSAEMAEYVARLNEKQIHELQRKMVSLNDELEEERRSRNKTNNNVLTEWGLMFYVPTKLNQMERDLEKLRQEYQSRKPLTAEHYTNSTYLGYISETHPDLTIRLDEDAVIEAFDRIKLGIRSHSLTRSAEQRKSNYLERITAIQAAKSLMLSRDPLLPELDKVSIREFNGQLGGLSVLQAKDRTGYTKQELKRNMAFKLCAQAVEKELFENEEGEGVDGVTRRAARSGPAIGRAGRREAEEVLFGDGGAGPADEVESGRQRLEGGALDGGEVPARNRHGRVPLSDIRQSRFGVEKVCEGYRAGKAEHCERGLPVCRQVHSGKFGDD